ncbi:MAG: molybdopterin-guanine dinucleotide biosynthesis protein B [Candidatus Syntrophonatronum acetioxidans]|uniref:Molybdopterin-guanine dinucleotide biosynthesis protein B n=1 Tax=Candidatus Syntrophonatronum acetioxidans TaxID=1795816 RepID=A0A424YHF5_9FIRM|nr:MAG: molybdopterin-guanine dinucleotide biosynthesis protein B [Candidatus Syntrophonatronum acetioxidans]
MIPIISVVGWSNSGKTTLICKIIPYLREKGYRVATVKHDRHGFDWDQPGKDTYMHRQAGAVATAISSPRRFTLVKELEEELSLEEIASLVGGVDLLITEGYKFGDKPKLEVFRRETAKDFKLVSLPQNLFAVASDYPFKVEGVPLFDLDDARKIAELIEEKFLKAP